MTLVKNAVTARKKYKPRKITVFPNDMYSIQDIHRLTGISCYTLLQAISEQRLPAAKVGNKLVAAAKDVNSFIRESNEHPNPHANNRGIWVYIKEGVSKEERESEEEDMSRKSRAKKRAALAKKVSVAVANPETIEREITAEIKGPGKGTGKSVPSASMRPLSEDGSSELVMELKPISGSTQINTDSYCISEVAKAIGVTVIAVSRMINNKSLKGFRTENGGMAIKIKDFEKFCREHADDIAKIKKLYSIMDIARETGLPASTVDGAIRRGVIKAVSILGALYAEADDINNYIINVRARRSYRGIPFTSKDHPFAQIRTLHGPKDEHMRIVKGLKVEKETDKPVEEEFHKKYMDPVDVLNMADEAEDSASLSEDSSMESAKAQIAEENSGRIEDAGPKSNMEFVADQLGLEMNIPYALKNKRVVKITEDGCFSAGENGVFREDPAMLASLLLGRESVYGPLSLTPVRPRVGETVYSYNPASGKAESKVFDTRQLSHLLMWKAGALFKSAMDAACAGDAVHKRLLDEYRESSKY